MQNNLTRQLELFTQNVQSLKGRIPGQSVLSKQLAALLYTNENRQADKTALRNAFEVIKQQNSFFSAFRGYSAMSLATLLALKSAPDQLLNNTMHVYELLKHAGFKRSDYLVIAAFEIADNAPRSEWETVVRRSSEFYSGMRQHHRFGTGRHDSIYAAMVGLSDMDINQAVVQFERIYRSLKRQFRRSRPVQALSQVLLFGEDCDQNVARAIDLEKEFRAVKLRMNREHTLASLGLLALLPQDKNQLAREVQTAFNYLRNSRAFGRWTSSKQQVLLYASAIVTLGHARELKLNLVQANVSTTVINLIIAQQVAAVTAATAASAAAVSASS